jgi:DNA-binding MarR family transcriptional regulator
VERQDLGALFARVTRRLVDAERPLLEAHGLTMWQYVALSHLAREESPTQLALARAMGYDKTRLIALLDTLEHDGLVARQPDPVDRRAKTVRLTRAGARRLAETRAEIRVMEEGVLAGLAAGEQDMLLDVLPRLAKG